MAEFYGQLFGARGPASRAGTKASGITAVAQSWDGSVAVYLSKQDGVTLARITVGEGSTPNPFDRVIFSGPIDALLKGEKGAW